MRDMSSRIPGAFSGRGRPARGRKERRRGRGGVPPPTGKIGYLSHTDVFQDFSPEELEEVDRVTAMTTCQRGKVFYTPGETGEVLFILKRGRVNVYRITADGRKLVTNTVEAGTVFGEMSLMGQGMYDSFAEAAEECTLCVMSRADVERLLASEPKLAIRVIEVMARKLREAEARVETVAFKSVPARLAATILQLHEGGEGEITGLSHQNLADMVGTYRETATRILNEFRAEGLISLGRMKIGVLRPEDLRAVAEQ
jgi:CRP/FNR family cyclic AMP-dependent transcriptional regulator